MGSRGASSGIFAGGKRATPEIDRYEAQLDSRFKFYEVGNAKIYKVGSSYAVYDFEREPRTGKISDTMVATETTLSEAKQQAAALNNSLKKWSYPGNDQRIEKLQAAYRSANSPTRIQSIAKDARALDKTISAEINRISRGYERDGSIEALMSQRRKIRVLIRDIGRNK